MEVLAISSHLVRYVLSILAVYFCITLFLSRRALGWLLVSALFLEPFLLLVMLTIHGRPLLAYKTVSASSDGVMQASYHMDFPFLYLVAVIGLFMLVRESQMIMENGDGVV